MAAVRKLGQVFLLLAILFLVLGIYLWLDGRATQEAGRAWFEIHLASLNYFEVIVSRHLGLSGFWHDAILPYLKLACWEATLWPVILFLVLGGFLSIVGRKRKRPSGFQD